MQRTMPCLLIGVALVTGRLVEAAPDACLDLRSVGAVVVASRPHELEQRMATLLVKKLQSLYGVDVVVTDKAPVDAPSIWLGRGPALASGVVREAELEAVKYDGFVIRVTRTRIALAGWGPHGTVCATYEFLRRIGLRLYPCREQGRVAEIAAPLPDASLRPFSLSTRPFFEYRELLGWMDQGRYGASMKESGGLGDLDFARDHPYFKDKGWLGDDHTAPYLVPVGRYYDEHPEYYAMVSGKRRPKTTPNVRVTLCLSNPAVARIASKRLLGWIERQKNRRFFFVTDGDAGECRCPDCLAADPWPDSATDRYLRWVNSVAAPVRERYPNKRLLALAYMNYTKPPVETRPAPNVTVMYCPWFWTARASSAVTFANPLNITAMKEFIGWITRFPGQVGLYDYPGAWVRGQADRIKFLAKNKVRLFYACGGTGDLYEWVNARLLWDPFLNTEDLIAEFVQAYYGPAAALMAEYLRSRDDVIDRGFVHSMQLPWDADWFARARKLLRQVEAAADRADEATRMRILDDVLRERLAVLVATHPQRARRGLRAALPVYRKDLAEYVALSKRIVTVWEARKTQYKVRKYRRQFAQAMKKLGFETASDAKALQSGDEAVFARALDSFEKQAQDWYAPDQTSVAAPSPPMSIAFDGSGEAAHWIADGSQADLIAAASPAAVPCPDGSTLKGVRLQAPFSRLPVIALNSLQIHAGRFYVERAFDPPLDASGRPFVNLHVWASRDVPMTVYVDTVHSDIDLHAGEQLVRIDMRLFSHPVAFNYDNWDKQIHRISFDLWPQDNYRPYPPAEDTEVVFLGVTLAETKPDPTRLPHAGKAIWLSQFRANVPRGVTVPRALYDKYMQRQRYRHVGLDYGSRWLSERFRTFTEHRALSPIFAIVTGPGPTATELETARRLSRLLERRFGVRLPVNPPGIAPSPAAGNVILLGNAACRAAGRVEARELDYVGDFGFVINAYQGRIAIAGAGDASVSRGVARYLEDHGLRFLGPGRVANTAQDDPFLHELYLPDCPHFGAQFKQTGDMLSLQTETQRALSPDSPDDALRLAEAIKDVARNGGGRVPRSTIRECNGSALSRYVAARLLWDPFADARRLVREYGELAPHAAAW